MAKVTYVDHTGTAVEVDIAVGENVMRGALYNGIEGITGECGGGLSCATCHCYVDDAWTDAAGGPSSEAEAELLESTAAEVKPSSRLSCQLVVTEALDGMVVHMPEHQL
ncbi:reductase [Novosphingobium barchaimii LL02]|uniref:Reductase n=1 Tax=Novosphingobium barchaimii LL02 TaxID=1114963 RepID=A0A0J7Y4W8_9SPHN|nr:2Fe-2S iron-sulfur cluster-binding protein [Novosphingobium barchaimii]KMS58919.1 reductase [Novosphingobium barchaimii LL02]